MSIANDVLNAYVDGVELEVAEDGKRFIITCKRGKWTVSAADFKTAFQNGLYYWQQYYADGEYNQ